MTQPKNELFFEIEAWATNAILNSPAWSVGELDYSEKSISAVEILLEEIAEKNLTLSDEKVTQLIQEYGCYLLLTAIKLYGGEFYWNEANNQPMLIVGEPDNMYILMTWDKVKGRLLGDKKDHIAYFMQQFSDEIKKEQQNKKILFS